MGRNCSVNDCTNRRGSSTSTTKHFYGLPTDPDRRRQWLAFLNRKSLPKLENVIICGAHFESGKANEAICCCHSITGR